MAARELRLEDDLLFISYLSKRIYNSVKQRIGPESFVKLRRHSFDVLDTLNNCDSSNPFVTCIRGSFAEGFEMTSSDVDTMNFPRHPVVRHENFCITDERGTVLIVDNNRASPGFVFIKCLQIDVSDSLFLSSIIHRELGAGAYISSTLFKEQLLGDSNEFYIHGPSITTNINEIERDFVPCLYSPSWPTQAVSFIHRSIRCGWPALEVLTEICRDGCLFVPVSNTFSYDDICGDMWRISFSLAEKRMIDGMNYSQFLCYGLLKIFLNEVLKNGQPKNQFVLCSYHMKNALFWEISSNSNNWSIDNHLFKFWSIFRRLLQWVQEGYCPHFFVSDRNMFLGRIQGVARSQLMSLLYTLYEDGVFCLLRAPSFAHVSNPFYRNRDLYDDIFLPPYLMERKLLLVIMQFQDISIENPGNAITLLRSTIDTESVSAVMSSTKLLRTNFVLQRLAEISLKQMTSNKRFFLEERVAFNILRKTKTFYMSNAIIMAKYLCNSGQLHRADILLEKIRSRINIHPITYTWRLENGVLKYALRNGFSMDWTIKEFVLSHVILKCCDTIDELYLECHAKSLLRLDGELFVPPVVFIDFLLLLNSNKLNKIEKRNHTLMDLRSLLSYDNRYHISRLHLPVSFEILGICEYLCGYKVEAFHAFSKALQDKYNDFKLGTLFRLGCLLLR